MKLHPVRFGRITRAGRSMMRGSIASAFYETKSKPVLTPRSKQLSGGLSGSPGGGMVRQRRDRAHGLRRGRWTARKRRQRLLASGLLAAAGLSMIAGAHAAQRFRADDWIVECDGNPGRPDPECSLTVPFWQSGDRGKGSFALVVMPQAANIGIVGQPEPIKAMLRVDKNPPIECRQARYCLFPAGAALGVVRELRGASLILIDVFTAKSQFHFSLSPKGYQAGLAQIRAWGYPGPTD